MMNDRNMWSGSGRLLFMTLGVVVVSLIVVLANQGERTPPGGVIVVFTDPVGAEVLLDGVSRGMTERGTGLRLTGIEPGRHHLLVRKKWFRPVERAITVTPDKRLVLHLRLGRPIGYLSVRSRSANARIEIRGLGTYDREVYRLEVPVGKYEITVKLPHRKPVTQAVVVDMGRETELYVDFGPDARSTNVKRARRPIARLDEGRPDRPLLRTGELIGVRVNGYLVPELISLPGGWFLMGSESGGEDEKPVHKVYVDGFAIGRVEVTNAQYKAFCDATGHPYPRNPEEWGHYFVNYPNHPVVMVSWNDAMAYCQWLATLTGRTYRLPTEAEWEYAARGGLVGKTYPWGEDEPSGRACYLEDQVPLGVPTMPVGSYPPNGYGLYDMAGNVWEWCWDWYDVSFYRSGHHRNPRGAPEGTMKVARGGAWLYGPSSLRCAVRLKLAPDTRHETVGFRVVAVQEESVVGTNDSRGRQGSTARTISLLSSSSLRDQ